MKKLLLLLLISAKLSAQEGVSFSLGISKKGFPSALEFKKNNMFFSVNYKQPRLNSAVNILSANLGGYLKLAADDVDNKYVSIAGQVGYGKIHDKTVVRKIDDDYPIDTTFYRPSFNAEILYHYNAFACFFGASYCHQSYLTFGFKANISSIIKY